jgi:hypothetical protein
MCTQTSHSKWDTTQQHGHPCELLTATRVPIELDIRANQLTECMRIMPFLRAMSRPAAAMKPTPNGIGTADGNSCCCHKTCPRQPTTLAGSANSCTRCHACTAAQRVPQQSWQRPHAQTTPTLPCRPCLWCKLVACSLFRRHHTALPGTAALANPAVCTSAPLTTDTTTHVLLHVWLVAAPAVSVPGGKHLQVHHQLRPLPQCPLGHNATMPNGMASQLAAAAALDEVPSKALLPNTHQPCHVHGRLCCCAPVRSCKVTACGAACNMHR